MRFQFKNGNRQVSVGGQEFHADSNGVISIPDALAPMLRATLGNDIMSAAPPPTDISQMSREQLTELLVEHGKKQIEAATLEQLRAAANATMVVPPVVRNDSDEGDQFDEMNRNELFEWLREHGVRAQSAHGTEKLRGMARQAAAAEGKAPSNSAAAMKAPAEPMPGETPAAEDTGGASPS